MTRVTARTDRLPGLDGLRAIAAVTVLSFHVAMWSRFAFAGPFASAFWELKGGVAIFFVISGAVLYLPFARAIRDREALPRWRGYARRRAVRILPAYWVVLTVFAVGPFGAGVFGPNVSTYYGLSQIYDSGTFFTGLPVAWSLCVEVSFYALLPLFAHAARRVAGRAGPRGAVRAQLFLIATAGLVSLVIRGALAGSLTGSPHGHGLVLTVALPGFMDWFAIGMALAVLVADWEVGGGAARAVAALGRRTGWCAVLALGAFCAGVPAQRANAFLPWCGLVTHVALGLGSGLLVLAAIAPGREGGRASSVRFLRSPWLAWLGTISYGIYLWHLVVLELISRQPHPRTLAAAILLWLAVLVGAVVLGAASWYLVERPLQRALRARENKPRGGGRAPEIDGGVQSLAEGLNPSGVAVDHLA